MRHEVRTIFDDYGSLMYQCDDREQADRYVTAFSDPEYPPHVDRTVSYIVRVQRLEDGEVVETITVDRNKTNV